MTNITAKVVADSISTEGKRITTFELSYPRFIHAEFMTHRMISKNAASSRAIPVEKMLENIEADMAMPVYWGKNQAGMSAKEEIADFQIGFAKALWERAFFRVRNIVKAMVAMGLHKQIVNRLVEPFQMIKIVATATEWDNFFWLRCHKDAQPEIQALAEAMWEAYKNSTPQPLKAGEWHTPYVQTVRNIAGDLIYITSKQKYSEVLGEEVTSFSTISSEQALKVSASLCAQTSFRKSDDSLEKAELVYDRLVTSKPVHASPLEHQATPINYSEFGSNDRKWAGSWESGVTALHKELGFMSGNFAGWIQHRQLLDSHTCWDYTGE